MQVPFTRRQSRDSGSTRRRGATLIDLTICVLVMGILAAVGAPKFAAVMSRLRSEAVAKRIAADLNYARQAAIRTSRKVSITFRASPAGYDMSGIEDPANPSKAYSVALADIDSSVVLNSFSFNGGTQLSFNNYGCPLVGVSPLAAGTVVLRSGQNSFTVFVSPATGESTVQ